MCEIASGVHFSSNPSIPLKRIWDRMFHKIPYSCLWLTKSYHLSHLNYDKIMTFDPIEVFESLQSPKSSEFLDFLLKSDLK